MKKRLRHFLPHTAIVLSIVVLVLLILDRFNPRMGFLNGRLSILYVALLCIVSLADAWIIIRRNRRDEDSRGGE